MRPKYHAQPGPGGSPKIIESKIALDFDDESEIPQMHYRPIIKKIKKEIEFDFRKMDRPWF